MRIIAGQAKGRRLIAPAGNLVRPTSDRVKEALFSALGSIVRGARVLDLFAGSGALGLEALSRGANSVTFVERSRKVAGVISRNIETLGYQSQSRLLIREMSAAVQSLGSCGERFDLVLMDPPYRTDLVEKTVATIVDAAVLKPLALIAVEHPVELTFEIPGPLRTITSKRYGTTALSTIQMVNQTGETLRR